MATLLDGTRILFRPLISATGRCRGRGSGGSGGRGSGARGCGLRGAGDGHQSWEEGGAVVLSGPLEHGQAGRARADRVGGNGNAVLEAPAAALQPAPNVATA